MIPQKKIEAEIQTVFKKIKTNLTLKEYSPLYSTGSCPGKLYGNAKIHKNLPTDNVNKLPMRSIVSKINTST